MKTEIEIKETVQGSWGRMNHYSPKKGDRGYIDGYVNQNDGYAVVVIGEHICNVSTANLKAIGLITEKNYEYKPTKTDRSS